MPKSKTGRDALPQRFRPFYDQALTEADLRYGAQEAAFGTVLGQLGRDRDRQILAQRTAQQSLLGSMQQSDNNVNRFYSDSGLTPTVLQSLAGSNTGARLAGEMAGYRSQNAQNLISAQAGGQYQQQRINQDYGDKRASLVDQLNAEQRERGTFTSSALEQLITGDRSTRHAANVEAAKQAHADAQAILNRDSAQQNALIGQGLAVDGKGNLTPLPGGKADPNAPGVHSKLATGLGGFALDVGLDPTTYLSFGVGSVGRKAVEAEARKATKQALKRGLSKKAADRAGRAAAQKALKRETNKGVQVGFAGRKTSGRTSAKVSAGPTSPAGR
jgi:hypothetical protein